MVIALALLLAPLASFAEDRPDYSNCSNQPTIGGIFTGQLDKDGWFKVDAAANGNPVSKRSRDTETLSLSMLSFAGNGRKAKYQYVLHRKDGKPESMELNYDPADFRLPNQPAPKDPGVGSVVRYAYVNGHCYVKEVAAKLKSGKEVVSYDFETCNNVLAAAKKHGGQKIAECASVLGEIDNAVTNGANRINGDKRQLQLSLGFAVGGDSWESKSASPYASGVWKTTGALQACAMARRTYGMEVDSSLAPFSGFAFVGGGGMVGTPTSSTSPSRDTRESDWREQSWPGNSEGTPASAPAP